MIAIIGASGFLGSCVLGDLVDKGSTVRTISRKPFNREGCENVVWDINDKDSAEALKGCDTLIHLVGIIRGDFRKVIFEGTKNVLRGCEEAGIKKIVFVSALGAGGA